MIVCGRGMKYYQESECLVLEVNSSLVVPFVSLPGALCEHLRTHEVFTLKCKGMITSIQCTMKTRCLDVNCTTAPIEGDSLRLRDNVRAILTVHSR